MLDQKLNNRSSVAKQRALHPPFKTVVPGLEISENSLAVLNRRYLAKDAQGKVIETPEQMFQRVARNIAEGDLVFGPVPPSGKATDQAFYEMMAKNEFMPNSPTIMNAGRELQQLSACFVLPVPDSIQGIFEAAKFTALIHKSGGGTGFAFSRLRPENDRVGSTGGIASGPVSFIRVFDTATDVVKQGGTRRGANMGILSVEHPDVKKFVHSKDDDKSLQNFNISVTVTSRFMEAIRKGEDYSLVNPHTKLPAGKLNAKQVFDEMVASAWKTGDPGIIFIDRMNEPHSNPVPKRGPIEATNPCGEQPLYPYDSCNLGSINLARFVQDTERGPEMDWTRLQETVKKCVHFLDNVIEQNRYPIPQIEETSRAIRRIGLGVMGWADLLVLMGIPYNSQQALDLADQVMSFITTKAADASEELASARGNFTEWADSVYGPSGPLGPRNMRNSTRTTIAPTGTISIIANCSSGVEPLFALSYVRNVMDNTKLVEVNPYFEEVAKREGFYSKELMEKLAERGTCHGMAEVPEWVQKVFVTAHDITPEWHVRMQAAFQKHTDNAVSKTVNFPNKATIEDVRTVYWLAYELGCKGITIYRDGSKSTQVLSTGETAKAREPVGAQGAAPSPVPGKPAPRARPAVTAGKTERIRTSYGNLYVTINFDEEGKPFEVFTHLGKAGSTEMAHLEAISRLVSLALRSGIDAQVIIEQLRGITDTPIWDAGVKISSAPDALALALARHALPSDETAKQVEQVWSTQLPLPGVRENGSSRLKVTCPECHVGTLTYQEGCLMCHSCGYNKCG